MLRPSPELLRQQAYRVTMNVAVHNFRCAQNYF